MTRPPTLSLQRDECEKGGAGTTRLCAIGATGDRGGGGIERVLVLVALLFVSANQVFAKDITVTQQQKNLPKVKVAFDIPTFSISYGQTAKLCATVKPASRSPNVQFVGGANGTFAVERQTDAQCAGAGKVALKVTSKDTVCEAQGQVLSSLNNKTLSTATGNIIRPTGESARLMGQGNCMPIGCFFKQYDLIFTGPQGMNLAGLKSREELSGKLKLAIENPPNNCPGPAPTPGQAQAIQEANGEFKINDDLMINVSGLLEECADRILQTVFVGACLVRQNTLTYRALPTGERYIARSDEQP